MLHKGYDIDISTKETKPGAWEGWAKVSPITRGKKRFTPKRFGQKGWPSEGEAIEYAVRFAKEWINQHPTRILKNNLDGSLTATGK